VCICQSVSKCHKNSPIVYKCITRYVNFSLWRQQSTQVREYYVSCNSRELLQQIRIVAFLFSADHLESLAENKSVERYQMMTAFFTS